MPITESRTLDFHVPATRYRVRVVDAQSGDPVRGATVSAANVWLHASGEEATIMQRASANDDGVAMLAPLRRGTLTVRARATGYFDSDAVDGGTIAGEESEGELEVKRRSVGESVPMRLRTAERGPVAGAEVWAVAATNGTRPPLWRGSSDSDGVVDVPRSVDGSTLLIRSRVAASAVRPFHAANERLLAWRHVREPEIVAGLRDAGSATISYPWPSAITIRPLE